MDEYKLQYRTIHFKCCVYMLANLRPNPRSTLPHRLTPSGGSGPPPTNSALLSLTGFSLPQVGLVESPFGCCAYLFKAFSRYS